MERQKPIAVLGAGSWGTALALHLAKLGQTVWLWTHEPSRVITLQTDRANNRYLPGHVFPDNLHVTSHLTEAVNNNHDILIAVPSAGFRNILLALQPLIDKPIGIISATKGLDLQTGELLHEVGRRVLGNQCQYAALSGPSFAREVAASLPTAVVMASEDLQFATSLSQRFSSPLFRVYLSQDIIGVEVGGVVKNVLAIAAGIADGMELGANARSALITRGLAEMTRIGVAAGGHAETFTGLTGLGDLILTCTDNQSRNRRFGLALGKGKTITEAEREIGQVIEGKRNAELIVGLAKKYAVDMPISETVWEVLQENITIKQAIQQLLSRTPRTE